MIINGIRPGFILHSVVVVLCLTCVCARCMILAGRMMVESCQKMDDSMNGMNETIN